MSVAYLLHMQCYNIAIAKLQHLTVAEYGTSSFPTDFIAILSYLAVFITSYIPSAKYLLQKM